MKTIVRVIVWLTASFVSSSHAAADSIVVAQDPEPDGVMQSAPDGAAEPAPHGVMESAPQPAVTPAASASPRIDYVVKTVADDWNSLEIVKLAIGLLTPAAMLFVGVWLDRRIKEFEHRQWSNQKVIEKRLEVYEKITPLLNELMCYFVRVGAWKEYDPTEVVGMKRGLDKIAHIYAPLFSPRFLEKYDALMGLCFATFRAAGKDAQLRAECQHYCDAYVGGKDDDGVWDPQWNDCFTEPELASDRAGVSAAYKELVGLIAQELGVGLDMNSAVPDRD